MKALVLNSGGVDSTTCVALAIEKYGKENVVTATLYYGQRHDKELECARKVAEHYGVRHIEEDISCVMKYAGDVCSLMKDSKTEIPDKSYAEQIAENGEGRVGTYVPFRNGLLLSIATAYADSLFPGQDAVVVYGAHADDAAGQAYADAVAEGSLIKMADGTSKPIEDVAVGDTIWAFDTETQGLVRSKVTAKISKGVKPVYDTGNGLLVSEKHIMWRAGVSGSRRFVAYNEMKRKDATYKVYTWPTSDVHVKNDRDFILGYIRGFLAGDGHIEESGAIAFYQNKSDVLEEIKVLIKGLGYSTTASVSPHGTPANENTKQGYSLQLSKGIGWSLLDECAAHSGSEDYARGYFNGFVIAEGGYFYNKADNSSGLHVSQSEIVNPEKVACFDSILQRLGIACIRWRNKHGVVDWRFNKAYRLVLRYGGTKLDDILNKMCERVNVTWLPQKQMQRISAPVKTVPCWDLTTTAHSFVADGVVVHNCSPAFADAMDNAISIGTYGKIRVWRPLINLNKAGVVAEGLRLKVPYELTWSCYKGGEKACGTCGTCIAEGTPVIMADGTQKAIETLKPGDMVWSMDEETGRARASKVLNVVCQGEKPVHTIGGIRMTDDHRVYVRSAGGVPSFREVSTLKRADAEYFGYVFPKEFLFEEDEKQFALGYLRGFAEGDGHIGERGVFTCQDSKDVLDEFWALYDKHVAPTKCNVHWDPKREIFIGSGGYGPVFAERTAYSDNPSYLRGYLNGMLIAEGCGAYNPFNKSFAYVLSQSTSANPEKCEMIDKAFAAYGMAVTMWEDKSFGFKAGGSAMRHWRFTQPWRVALRYGASKRADLFARVFEKGVPMRMDQIALGHYPNPAGTAVVWDIETEGHTFFAGNLLVHNCIDRKAAFEANGVKDPIEYV